MKRETLHEGVESEIPVDDYDYDSSTNSLDAAFSHHPHHHPAKKGGRGGGGVVFFLRFFGGGVFCFHIAKTPSTPESLPAWLSDCGILYS